MFTGILVAFAPMHITGLRGMPRRVWTYQEGLGWDGLNLVSTIGAFLIAAGVLLFVANLVLSLGRRPAPADPWGSGTLEWAPGPPPKVSSQYPLWEQADEVGRGKPVGEPALPSAMPLLAAACLAAGVVGLIFDPLVLGAGLALAFIAVIEWLRPPGPPDPRAVGLGVVCGLFSLFVAVGSLAGSWYYLAARTGPWPVPPVEPPDLWWGLALTLAIGTAGLLALTGRLRGAAAAALLFVVVLVLQLIDLDYTQAQNASASVLWAVWISAGLLMAVLAGAAGGAAQWARGGGAVALYGGFLAASWPLVLFTLYVAPRL
jgi:hypothetical protein